MWTRYGGGDGTPLVARGAFPVEGGCAVRADIFGAVCAEGGRGGGGGGDVLVMMVSTFRSLYI